jgi:hypothetical protein
MSTAGDYESNTLATTAKPVTGNGRTVSRASQLVEGLTSMYTGQASSKALTNV